MSDWPPYPDPEGPMSLDLDQKDRRSPSPGRRATDPSPDIIALERAADSLTRFGDIKNAVALWAIALRLREEGKCPVT